jgi:hypothetical protein
MNGDRWIFRRAIEARRGSFPNAKLGVLSPEGELLAEVASKAMTTSQADRFQASLGRAIGHVVGSYRSGAVENPSLARHIGKPARWHITSDRGEPLADVYFGIQADAGKVARLLANLRRQSVRVYDNTGLPPHLSAHRDAGSYSPNPNPKRPNARGTAARERRLRGRPYNRKTRRAVIGALRRPAAPGNAAQSIHYFEASKARRAARGNPRPGKMRVEDYNALRAAVEGVLAKWPADAHSQYEAAGLSPKRFRWDALWASKFNVTPLYAYLNDANIDTALRSILGHGPERNPRARYWTVRDARGSVIWSGKVKTEGEALVMAERGLVGVADVFKDPPQPWHAYPGQMTSPVPRRRQSNPKGRKRNPRELHGLSPLGVKLTAKHDLGQAVEDWRSGRAYLDNAGNYRLRSQQAKRGAGPLKWTGSGKVAPWNRAVKAAFSGPDEFHRTAMELGRTPNRRRPKHGASGTPRTVRGVKRKRNPRGSEYARAVKTYRMWHEFDPHRVTRMKGPDRLIPRTLVKLGEIRSIDYISDKYEGRPVTYTHQTDRPRPVLATDPDGRNLHIVGGRIKITADGLIH